MATLALGLALGFWILAFLVTGHPWTMVGLFSDAVAYLWMADALSRSGADALASLGHDMLRGGRFPPGYPLYLWLFGADVGPSGMRRANLAQMLSVLACLALTLVLVRRLGGSWLLAVLGAGYVASLPWIHPWALELVSEPLFTALLLVACLMSLHPERRQQRLAMAVLLGLACLVRTMGLALLPALWLHACAGWRAQGLGRSQAGLRAAVLTLLALLPSLAWSLYQSATGLKAGDHYLAEFSAALGASDGLGELVGRQVHAVGAALVPASLGFDALRAPLGLVLLAAAGWAAWRLRHRVGFIAYAWAGLLAILLLWPYPEHAERLVGPLTPLSFGLLVAAANGGRLHLGPARRRALLAAALVAAAVVLHALLIQGQSLLAMRQSIEAAELSAYARAVTLSRDPEPARAADNLHRVLEAAAALDALLPDGACVVSSLPEIVALRASRPVRQLLMPFEAATQPCRYLLAVNLLAPQRGLPALYPLLENGQGLRVAYLSRSAYGFVAAVIVDLEAEP